MSFADSLNSMAFSAFAEHIKWSDTAGNSLGLLASALGRVEFWIAWLAVDLVGVPLAFSSGLPFSGLVQIVCFVLVIAGMYAWWQQTRAPRPVLEGAAA